MREYLTYYQDRIRIISEGEDMMGFLSNYFEVNPKIPKDDDVYPRGKFNAFHRAVMSFYSAYNEHLGQYKVTSVGLDAEDPIIALMEHEFNEIERNCEIIHHLREAIVSFLCTGEAFVEFEKNDRINGHPFKCSVINNRDILLDPTSRRPDLGDAQWAMRKSWVNKDTVLSWLKLYGYKYDKGKPKKLTVKECEQLSYHGNQLTNFSRLDDPVTDDRNIWPYSDLDKSHYPYFSCEDKIIGGEDKVCVVSLYKRQDMAVNYIQDGKVRVQVEDVPFSANYNIQLGIGSKVFEETYIGDQLVLRTNSRYGNDILAPWVRFVYGFDQRTNNPFGLGKILADYQVLITRLLNFSAQKSQSQGYIVDADALTDGNKMNDSKVLKQFVKNANKPGGVLFVSKGTSQKIQDVISPIPDHSMERAIALQRVMENAIGIVAPPTTQGDVGRLNSAIAIDAAADAAKTPLGYGIDRFKFGMEKFGDLILNNIIRYEIDNLNVNDPISDIKDKLGKNIISRDKTKIDNLLLLHKFKLIIVDIPHSKSAKEEQWKTLAEFGTKTGNPHIMSLLLMLHPYIDKSVKEYIMQMMNQEDPREKADLQTIIAKAENIKANTEKQINQSKHELDKIDLTQAKTMNLEKNSQNDENNSDVDYIKSRFNVN